MSERNEETINFFERVNNLFPKHADGNIAIERLGYDFFDGLDDSPESQYIRDRIPESYVGEKLINPSLCCYYFRDQIKEGKDPESIILSQIKSGNFEDIGALDSLADSFETYRKIVTKVLRKYVDYNCGIKDFRNALEVLWRENVILPENMREDVRKHRGIYNQIFNDRGSYKFNDGTCCTFGILKNLVDGTTTLKDLNVKCNVSSEELEFAYKVSKYYSFLAHKPGGWVPTKIPKIDEEKSALEKKDAAATELKKELGGINESLAEYQTSGFFRKAIRRIGGYNPQEEKTKGARLGDKIISILSSLHSEKSRIEEYEDCNEMEKNYREGFKRIIKQMIVPEIKEECAKYGDKEQFDKFTDFFFSDEILGENTKNPLRLVDDALSCSYEELEEERRRQTCYAKIGKIMSTVAATPSAFLRFEKLEQKTLETTLKIIREELGKIPVEGREKPLSTDYRNTSAKVTSRFYYYTCPPSDIWKDLSHEEGSFERLMETENLEEYIKGVGSLCSRFITTFPYEDGNGKTLRCLANILLAHRGIIIPSLYESMNEKANMLCEFDHLVLDQANYNSRTSLISQDFNNAFLETVRSVGIDITGQNRLSATKTEEKAQEDEHQQTQP